MFYIVGYDINTETAEGKRRLNKTAKICKKYGQRIQNSLYECVLNGADYALMKHELLKTINEKEDSLTIYNLGKNYHKKVEHFGAKDTIDMEGEIIL